MGCRSYDEVSRTGFASWSFPRAGAPCHGSHQLVLKFIDLKMLRANHDVLFANSTATAQAKARLGQWKTLMSALNKVVNEQHTVASYPIHGRHTRFRFLPA